MARNRRDDDEPRVWALRDRTVVAPQTLLARNMRRSPTTAEKKLWWHLHRLSVNGSQFRRQVRIGRYIADFASHKARLVVEVDGGQHAENAADAERTKFIEGQGYRVLRFWNNDVLGNIDGVLEVIQAAIDVGSLDNATHSPPFPMGKRAGLRRVITPCPTARHPTPSLPRKGGGSLVTELQSHSQLSRSDRQPEATQEQKRSNP